MTRREYHRARRARLRAAGRCVACGEPNSRSRTHATCAPCVEYAVDQQRLAREVAA